MLKKNLVKFLLTKYGPTQMDSQKKKKKKPTKTQIINNHPSINQNHQMVKQISKTEIKIELLT